MPLLTQAPLMVKFSVGFNNGLIPRGDHLTSTCPSLVQVNWSNGLLALETAVKIRKVNQGAIISKLVSVYLIFSM